MKKLLGVFVSLLLILNCLPTYTVYAEDAESPVGFTEAARTNKIALYYREDRAEIAVKNLTDGKWWYSCYPDIAAYENAADTVKNKMESLLTFDYIDMGGNNSKVKTVALQEIPHQVSASKMDNGFSYLIVLQPLNITLKLEFILNGSSLQVRIPENSFQENVDGLEKSKKALEETQRSVTSLEKALSQIRSNMSVATVGQAEYELFMLMFDACQQEIIKIRDNVKGEGIVFTAISNIRSNLDIIFTNLPDTNAYGEERNTINQYLQTISEQTDIVAQSATCLVSCLSIMPYFGSTTEEKDGYAFYPDGPGAISYFDDILPDYIGYYDSPVYAVQEQDIDMVYANKKTGKKIASAPVFGIRSQQSAFIAYIEQGDTDARISYYPRTQLMPLNAVYSTFIYRNFYTTTTSNAQKMKVLEKERIAGDRQLTYTFLSGEQANYSGMAKVYRQYLLDSGRLVKNINNSNPRIAIDILMGIRAKQFLFEKFVSMTSFKQAEEILEELYKRGVTQADIALLGWNETGILRYPYANVPGKKLGGEKGICTLAETAEQLGYPLLLHIDPISAQKGVGGFSPVQDVVKQKSSLVVTDSSQKNYWFSPQNAFQRLLLLLSPKNEWLYRTGGLYLDNVGSLLYTDYSSSGIVTRKNTAEWFAKMCEQTEESLGQVMIGGSNVNMARYADMMREVPTQDTGYFFTSETVPFLQIIYHGYISYSDKPFNLFANAKVEKLRAIEYGSMPYYKLTYDSPSKLKNTTYNALFSSEASQWYQDIQDTNELYQEIFADSWSCTIDRHDKIAEDVYRTTYSDGTAVYVNYRDTDYKDEGVEICPYSYFVRRKG